MCLHFISFLNKETSGTGDIHSQGTQEYPHFTYLISRLLNTWLPQGPEHHWAWYWCSLAGKVCAQCGLNVLKKIIQTYNHIFSLWIKLKYHICKWQISFVFQCILICSTSYSSITQQSTSQFRHHCQAISINYDVTLVSLIPNIWYLINKNT